MVMENIRIKIESMIEQAKGQMDMPEPVQHMLVSICVEMYRQGVLDGFKITEEAIKTSRETFLQ